MTNAASQSRFSVVVIDDPTPPRRKTTTAPDFAEVLVRGEEFGIVYSDDAKTDSTLFPKQIRLQGPATTKALKSMSSRNDFAELHAVASRSKSLLLNALHPRMNLRTLLKDFPVNFPTVEIIVREASGSPDSVDLQSAPLYEYIERLVGSWNVRCFDLIGDAAKNEYDSLLYDLITQDQTKDVFVDLKHVLHDEQAFLRRLLLFWIHGEPWHPRKVEITFHSRFEDMDLVRRLPCSVTNLSSPRPRLYHHLSHPRNPNREVRLSRNHLNMLRLEFN